MVVVGVGVVLVVYTKRCEVFVHTPQALNHLSSLFLPLASLALNPPSLPHPSFPELANQIQYSIIQDIQQGESWENGKTPHSRDDRLRT